MKPGWSTEIVLGLPGLHGETLSQKKKGEKKSFIFLLMAIWLVGLEIMHIVHFGERRACPVVIGTELLHVMEHLPIKFPIYLTLFCSVLYGNSKFQAQVSLCSVATCFQPVKMTA